MVPLIRSGRADRCTVKQRTIFPNKSKQECHALQYADVNLHNTTDFGRLL